MIAKKIKKATRSLVVDNGIYSVGIEAIYMGFQESKSPIDEELVFWTVIYTAFYGLDEAEVAELVSETSLPEFFLASRKVLGNKPMVKAYLESYTQYKIARSKTTMIEDILGKLDTIDFEKIINELPEGVKEILKVK